MKERFIVRETVKFGVMNDDKRTFQLQCKNVMVLLFLAMQVVPTAEQSSRPEFKLLQISPNSSFVALGQPLKLNITFNVTDIYQGTYTTIAWSFRRFSSSNSTSFKKLADARWSQKRDRIWSRSIDSRASIVDKATLILVNTTLNDSGTYRCDVRRRSIFGLDNGQDQVHFTVNIDELKANISCSQNTKLIEGDHFSCSCFAVGRNMVRTASWVKNEHILGDASSHSARLTLRNVSKDNAGTYVCRAKDNSLVDERTTEIIVYYHPRIIFFERGTFQNNVLQLTCVADGLPEPSYTFLTSKGTELAQSNNGVVIISNYSSTFNESYTCIAKNKLGGDERRLNADLDSSTTAKKQQKGNNNGIEWYIPLISGIVGVLTGISLVCGFLWIRRRHVNNNNSNVLATELRTQSPASATIYSEPTTPATPQQRNSPTADDAQVYYSNVPLRECSSPHYQSLSKVRENEENVYQDLVSQAD